MGMTISPDGTPVDMRNAASLTLEETIRRADEGDVTYQVLAGLRLLQHDIQSGGHHNFKRAMEYFEMASDAGSPVAQGYYGVYLAFSGQEKGLSLLDESARKGVGVALGTLGELYLDGIHVPMDTSKALDFFAMAVEKCDGKAACELGHCYRWGTGVKEDKKKAFHYYCESLKMGCDEAAVHVGACLVRGIGTDPDLETGEMLLRSSASKGSAEAFYELSLMQACADLDFPDHQKALEYIDEALELKPETEEYLYLKYQILCGEFDFEDQYPATDEEIDEGMEILEELAERGFMDARLSLAAKLIAGFFVEEDPGRAIEILTKAVEEDDEDAMALLGTELVLDERFRNVSRGMALLREGVSRGSGDAMLSMYYVYKFGVGVKKDRLRAARFERMAEDAGYSDDILDLWERFV